MNYVSSRLDVRQFFLFKNMKDNTIEAFFALLRAGLWEKDIKLGQYGEIDYEKILRYSEEQSVVGIVTAGLEHVADKKVTQDILLQFIGETIQLEHTNTAMNTFVKQLVHQMKEADIYTILVKGQGIAQCYERPLWRTSGDMDLLLEDDNYEKAKAFLGSLSTKIDKEGKNGKHLGMTIGQWEVELHGKLYTGLSRKVDMGLKDIYENTFYRGCVRLWDNHGVTIHLLGKENDVVYVFSHILQHFYKGGIGLRQICDWCRLLWFFKESLDHNLIETRIREMGLMSEWKAFGMFAVENLGMDDKAVPFLNLNDKANPNQSLKRKSEKIKDFILMSGNFGHKRDMSYYDKYPYIVRKFYSMKMRVGDLISHTRIFPLDSLRFSFRIMFNGVRSSLRGE